MTSFLVLLKLLVFTTILMPSQFKLSTGQLLTAVQLNTTLAFPNKCTKPFYDGDDKIYLLGGCEPETYTDILVFSLSSETIEKVGSMPGSGIHGNVQADNTGNIFYFGGGAGNFSQIYKFDPLTKLSTTAATLPYGVRGGTTIKYDNNTVYIVGGNGQGNNVLAFDLLTLTYTAFDDAPLEIFLNRATSIRFGDKAYIFGSYYSNHIAALELSLDTLELKQVGPATLPRITYFPSSVWDSLTYNAYIIGGHGQSPTDGIIQFNPTTFENTFLHVRNFPVHGVGYLDLAPGSVFVPKLNRIYCFGGGQFNSSSYEYKARDEIFYMDLAPLNPTTTTGASSTTSNPTTTSAPASSTTSNPTTTPAPASSTTSNPTTTPAPASSTTSNPTTTSAPASSTTLNPTFAALFTMLAFMGSQQVL